MLHAEETASCPSAARAIAAGSAKIARVSRVGESVLPVNPFNFSRCQNTDGSNPPSQQQPTTFTSGDPCIIEAEWNAEGTTRAHNGLKATTPNLDVSQPSGNPIACM